MFIEKQYECMIGELIHDTFYVGSTNRGKISGIRTFSEVLIRKILNIGSERKLMLGKLNFPAFNKDGKALSGAKVELNLLTKKRKEELLKIVERIRPPGNDATHTQHVEPFSNEELELVSDALFDLYAFMFIDYFLKYKITHETLPEVFQDFSLLPPIIRYKTLLYLFNNGNTNVYVADRLCLAMLKTYDKDFTMEWLSQNIDILKKDIFPNDIQFQFMFDSIFEKVVEMNKVDIPHLVEKYGKEQVNNTINEEAYIKTVELFDSLPYKNTYELCLHKVNAVSNWIELKGKMYEDFEQALSHYKQFKSCSQITELSELHKLMDFVFIGRSDIPKKDR